ITFQSFLLLIGRHAFVLPEPFPCMMSRRLRRSGGLPLFTSFSPLLRSRWLMLLGGHRRRESKAHDEQPCSGGISCTHFPGLPGKDRESFYGFAVTSCCTVRSSSTSKS